MLKNVFLFSTFQRISSNAACGISTCQVRLNERSNKLFLKPSKRKASSHEWLQRQLNDPYVKWARVEQYRCRSAFKLLEIDDKYKILSPGMNVVDCGAAPGSWTQVLVKRCNSTPHDSNLAKGCVISLDIQEFSPVEGAQILPNSDITAQATQEAVRELLDTAGGVDAVVSDMAPSPSGFQDMDHESIVRLSYTALRFCLPISKVGGFFLTKIWDGRLRVKLEKDLLLYYDRVQIVKPKASRSDSAEIFVLARDFKGLKEKRAA